MVYSLEEAVKCPWIFDIIFAFWKLESAREISCIKSRELGMREIAACLRIRMIATSNVKSAMKSDKGKYPVSNGSGNQQQLNWAKT